MANTENLLSMLEPIFQFLSPSSTPCKPTLMHDPDSLASTGSTNVVHFAIKSSPGNSVGTFGDLTHFSCARWLQLITSFGKVLSMNINHH